MLPPPAPASHKPWPDHHLTIPGTLQFVLHSQSVLRRSRHTRPPSLDMPPHNPPQNDVPWLGPTVLHPACRTSASWCYKEFTVLLFKLSRRFPPLLFLPAVIPFSFSLPRSFPFRRDATVVYVHTPCFYAVLSVSFYSLTYNVPLASHLFIVSFPSSSTIALTRYMHCTGKAPPKSIEQNPQNLGQIEVCRSYLNSHFSRQTLLPTRVME